MAKVGRNPTLIAWMQSGYAVMCDTQSLLGYVIQVAVLLVEHLNSLSLGAQTLYLCGMALLGLAVEEVTGRERVVHGIFGGLHQVPHSHIMPRYGWEGRTSSATSGMPTRTASSRSTCFRWSNTAVCNSGFGLDCLS